MARADLRLATAADAPKKPLGLVEAARRGDVIAELKAMRLVLARAIESDKTSPRDLAALSRRQIEIGREIRTLEALEEQEREGDDGPADDETLDPAAI